MNIWILTNEYPPFFGGGIGTYVNTVAKMFALAGHKITVFTQNTDCEIIEKPMKNLTVCRFKFPSKGISKEWSFYYTALSYRFLKVILDKLAGSEKLEIPDVIEVQDCSAVGYFLLQSKAQGEKLLQQIPIVVHMHTPLFESNRANLVSNYSSVYYLLEKRERFCLDHADGLLCPSDFLKIKLLEYFKNRNQQIIPIPLHHVPFSLGIKRMSKKIDMLCFGRMEYRKGYLQILKQMALLWEEGLSFYVVFAGEDIYLDIEGLSTQAIIQEKYGKYIKTGLLTIYSKPKQEILFSLIKSAKIVIVPSTYENFPSTCIEAMSFAKPILASASGGQAEMVGLDEQCGLIFDWNIPGDFERQLKRLLQKNFWELLWMGAMAKYRIYKLCNHKENVLMRQNYFKQVIAQESKTPHKEILPPKELLSVIIPFQDDFDYFAETLQSILFSHYPFKEVIIVNAASNKQESLKLIEEIEIAKFPGVKIINMASEHLGKAINEGVKVANGKYLSFINPGEQVALDFFTKTIAVLDGSKKAGFAYSWVKDVSNSHDKENKIWSTMDMMLPWALLTESTPSIVVVKRQCFLEQGLYDEGIPIRLGRPDSWLRIYNAGFEGIAVPEVLSFVRGSERQIDYSFFVKRYPELYKKHIKEIISLLIANKEVGEKWIFGF